MASKEDQKPLLSDLIDRSSPQNVKNSHQRRRYVRCCSAPSSESNHPELHVNDSFLNPESKSMTQQLNFKKIFMLLAVYLGIGTLCFFLVRHQIKGKKTNGVLDAIYFCVVTMTTVGYGDLVPNSIFTKLLACIYVFTGMALGGLFLSNAADYIVEKQEIILVRAIHMHEKFGPNEIQTELETHKVKYKFLMAGTLLLVLITVGTVFLSVVEELSILDALYCVCSTITTLGYGDESFSTRMGRTFAIFWILSSTICLAQFFLYLAELYTERRQRSLVKWVLSRRMTFSDIEAADIDQDKSVSASEFIIYKLKEMGKISQKDIAILLKRFKDLDFDQSGTLTVADVLQSQSS